MPLEEAAVTMVTRSHVSCWDFQGHRPRGLEAAVYVDSSLPRAHHIPHL